MPIDTDSERWTEGERPATERDLIVAFLSENRGRAYNVQEICDAVLGTEVLDDLMDGEVEASDLGDSGGQATFKLATLFDTMTKAELLLQDLERRGVLESRLVEGENSGHYYTIAETALEEE
jgi:hypothetical protein